jgi:hypothetical protein
MSSSHRFGLVLVLAGVLALPGVASAQSDGLLGIYFDREATRCTGSVGSGSTTTMYVVLIGDGATSSGTTGAEFRIEKSTQAYFFPNETGFGNVQLGLAFDRGINIGFGACQSSRTVPIMSFQVLNPGGAPSDAILRVTQHSNPSNPNFQCALAVQCDAPTYTSVCVEGGKAVLNPATERPCGSSREEAEWTRVKGLYKP